MHPSLVYPFDGAEISKRRRRIRRELMESGRERTSVRIAILGGSTTHDLAELLELFLLDSGFAPTFYESAYGAYWQEAVFGEELGAFAPQLVLIHTGVRNITAFPAPGEGEPEVEARLEAQLARLTQMWEALSARFGCPIIQNNFEKPVWRMLGNRDAWEVCGYTRFTELLNERLYAYARTHKGFYINDCNTLSAEFGLSRWLDAASWHMYKYSPAPAAVPLLAHNVAGIVRAIYGRSKKVLALDLDNTLWGGVVGDDGPEGLEIGHETPRGEVFSEFQAYCRMLRDTGVLLAVLSKNEEKNALAGLSHPEGTLGPEDFTEILANWQPKSENLAELARRLNLLPESMVFADDNPAEREIVASAFGGVAVPRLTAPEEYVRILDGAGYFERLSLSEDDLRRAQMYTENKAREQLLERVTDYGAYLEGLQMRAQIAPFEPLYYARISQLCNKSNQFNLTTLRVSEAGVAQMAESERWVTLCGRLSDRFGDNGVVALTAAEADGECLHIRLWLMSCRVLKRDMEYAMLDCLVREAAARGMTILRGYYLRSPKNAMVAGLYRDFGFTLVQSTGEDTVWELALSDYVKKDIKIDVNGGK